MSRHILNLPTHTMEYYEYRSNKRSSDNDINSNSKMSNSFDVHKREDRQKALQLLRDKVGASMNLALKDKSCCLDDQFLSRFMFATAGKVDDALNQLIRYLTFKKENIEWLRDMSIFDEKIQLALRDGNPRVLRQRDRKGRKIITFSAANWDPHKYSLTDLYRAFLISLDKLLENVQNQALGFVVIVDWTDVNMNQAMHLTPKILKQMVDGLQDCVPAIFSAIHFISQPWYIEIVLTILKSLLTENMRSRLLIHGSNLTTLHNHVHKEVLPPDLGGEGPAETTLDWYHYLLESSQTVENQKSYRLLQSIIYTKIPN